MARPGLHTGSPSRGPAPRHGKVAAAASLRQLQDRSFDEVLGRCGEMWRDVDMGWDGMGCE